MLRSTLRETGHDVTLPIEFGIEPMLAKNASSLPSGEGWLFEPKWDGFRCLVFRDGHEVQLQSRSRKPLARYFPELLDPLRAALPERCVIDGEVVVPIDGALSFDALGQRIHPAASRVTMLSEETPARYIAFDVLAVGDEDLREVPFGARRERLEALLADPPPSIHLTPATTDAATAGDWFERFEGAGLDGVIGKPVGDSYAPGKRALLKLKAKRTIDVVVAGYRPHKAGDGVGSLLLGLYGDAGSLHHIGVASSFSAKQRPQLAEQLEPFELTDPREHPWGEWMDADSHDGEQRMPGAPNRWSGKRDHSWVPLDCSLVAEVTCNQLTEGRLRHPAKMQRWRPDREPTSCTYDQLHVAAPAELRDLFATG